MANKSGFNMDLSGILSGLTDFESRAQSAIRMYAETSAVKLQNYAKENARWTDRTGHARQRLKGSSYPVSEGYELSLAHGVEYGIWLELAHEKRFSIIPETIERIGAQEIMPGFKKLLDRLGGGK